MTLETTTAGFSPARSYVDRRSYIELNGRSRAHSLLDPSGAKELVGPFDRVMSPWLPLQGIAPESDDGCIVVKGRIAHCHIGDLKDGVAFYRSGVEFIEASEHVDAAIASFVEALKLVQRAQSAVVPPIIDGQVADS